MQQQKISASSGKVSILSLDEQIKLLEQSLTNIDDDISDDSIEYGDDNDDDHKFVILAMVLITVTLVITTTAIKKYC